MWKGWFSSWLKKRGFSDSFIVCKGLFVKIANLNFEGSSFNQSHNSNFKIKDFEVKISLQSLKTNKKCQIYGLADHGVKWVILKMNKIRDQGMEIQLLCYVWKYVYVV